MNNERSSKTAAVVLLSGGLDSTVSLALSRGRTTIETAIFFDYKQHASIKEREAASRIAEHYETGFEIIELPWLGEVSSSSLIAGKGEPPHLSLESSGDAEQASARAVWVENRNTIFLGIAAAVAAERDCRLVIAGFNAEEARDFPDNSEIFIDSMNKVLELGVSKPVRIVSPTIAMGKREIASEGLRLDIPWNMIWSCYRDEEMMCGDCESCIRLLRAVSGTEAESRVRLGGG